MGRTLRAHHPEAQLTVLLLDAEPDEVASFPGAHLLDAASVVGEGFGLLAAANPPAALSLAVLPHLLRLTLASEGGAALYLGSGQRVLGSLDALVSLMGDHDIVLVARARSGKGGAIAAAESGDGPFSRQLLGLRAGPCAEALLDAWPRYFMSADDGGAGAMRAWMDGIPALVADVAVLRDPGYGLDPRSLAATHVLGGAGESGDALEVDGVPARVIDFGELDPDDPPSWFDGNDRIQPGSAPVLRQLVSRQVEDLEGAGWQADAAHAPFARLDDGLRMTATIRTLLARGIADGAITRSPFIGTGRAELYEYLNQLDGRGREAGLTRLHMAIWEARADLRSGYPHIDGPDGAGLAGWLCLYGAEQEGLVQELLPPTPELAYRDADPHIHEGEPRWGTNVVGFFTAELGVGEAARLLLAGLDARQVPAMPIQGNLMPPARRGVEFSYMAPDDAAYPINILCINGDGIPVFAREAGRSFFEGRYSIALWWWEAGEPPASWIPAYEFLDEVWVASRFIYDAIAPTCPVPVVHIRLPLIAPEVARASRAELGLPDHGFLFLCVHDYHSVAARKNPVAVVEAFRRAFAPGSGAKLVVKSINAKTHPREHARVLLAAGEREDIMLLDDYVPASRKNAMIDACDCYVSLHRSEGFGIPLAEAMMLAKPAIATRYGGSLEFMNDENSYLVDCALVPVGDGAYPYAPDAVWAEPDIDHAASLMRRVFADQQEARECGQAARRQLLERHSPATAGKIMEERLSLVHRRLCKGGARSLNLAHIPAPRRDEEIRELIAGSPALEVGRGRLGRLKARAYQPATNWASAHVAHQRSVEEAMQLELEGIDDRLREIAGTLQEQQRALHAETLALLRRLEADLADARAGVNRPAGGSPERPHD